jgi:hypothetical protein
MKHRLKELGEALKQGEHLDYDEAWSMPMSYYTEETVPAVEREHLFAKEWICLGRVEEVPKPGDARNLGAEPLRFEPLLLSFTAQDR